MTNLKNIRIGVVVLGGLLLFVFHSPQVQELILQLGEKLKGASLNPLDQWIRTLELIPLLFFLCALPFCFKTNINGKLFCLAKEKDFHTFVISFPKFVHHNISLLILVAITTLAIHGIKLGEQVIPIDTELWLDDRTMNWKEIGRFSLILLQGFTTLMGQNHWVVNFFTILFSIIGTLTWCYLLYAITGIENKFPYFAFALVYSISPIWVDLLYFTCLSLEVSLGMALTPFAIYLSFLGLTKKNPLFLVLGCLILIFMIGMYQSFVVVFCCGLLICHFFFCTLGKYTQKEMGLVFFKGIIFIVIALLGYFLIEKLIQNYIFKVSSSDYLINQSRYSLLDIFNAIPIYLARLLRHWTVEIMLICLIFPFILIKELYHKKTWWSVVTILCITVAMFAFPLATGGRNSFRAQLMEPVVVGFVAFLFFVRLGKDVRLIKGVFIAICLLQLCSSSLVNYTDYLRYQQDKIVANDIHKELQQQRCGDLPIILYGKYSPQYNVDHKTSEVSGHSIFEWIYSKDSKDSTGRGLSFMKILGYNYESTDDKLLIQKARSVAETMNDYPQPGFVQNLGDVVVVRLSETTYKPESE